jgi:hypothetical protein
MEVEVVLVTLFPLAQLASLTRRAGIPSVQR